MTSRRSRVALRSLLLLLLLAGQGAVLAHGVDEATHPSQQICDQCIAGQAMGADAPKSVSFVFSSLQTAPASTAECAQPRKTTCLTPPLRAPPQSFS